LGLLIGHLGPQRLQQLATSDNPFDRQWAMYNVMANAALGPDESDSGDEGDGEPEPWDYDSEDDERHEEPWDGQILTGDFEAGPWELSVEAPPGFVLQPDETADYPALHGPELYDSNWD